MTQGAGEVTGLARVLAPLPGVVLPLSEVPDPVFAGGIVGPGVAIDPHREGDVEVVAPTDGRVLKLHPHAFVLVDAGGRGVLVHLGIDTVQLHGEGFMLHVTEDDEVAAGELMVTWSPAQIEAGGRSPVCPVIALDARAEALTVLTGRDVVDAGDPLFDRA